MPKAKKAAFVAIGLGRPGAALAALLRAAELQPKDPVLLMNAAVVLIDRQRPREALGLIEAARELPKPRVVPLGMSFGALLDNAQGHAFLLTGRYQQAEALLRKAAKAEPLLAEARTGVGVALVCQRKQQLSPLWMARGSRRLDFFEDSEEGPVAPEGVPNALDLSQGKEATFPVLQAPGTPQKAVANEGVYGAAFEGSIQKSVEVGQEGTSHLNAATQRYSGTPAQPFFIMLLNYGSWLRENHPDIKAANEALIVAHNAVGGPNGVVPGFPGQDQVQLQGEECGYAKRHSQMWSALLNLYSAHRNLALADYRVATGIAANASDPDLNQWYNLNARAGVIARYGAAMQLPYYFAQRERRDVQNPDCGAGGSESPDDVAGEPSPAAGAPPCPPELKALRLKIKLVEPSPVGVDFEGNCEKVKLEVSAATHGVRGLGWVGPFAEGSYEFGNRDVTIFAGAKGQLGGKHVGLTGKAGPYVKFGPSTGLRQFGESSVTVKDYGVRLQGAVEVNQGSGQVMTIGKWDSKIDISFVNGL